MPRYRIQNIDRKTNKPELKNSESTRPDPILNRANQVRRDDDVVRTPKRTVYDIDYAIKWFLDNEIQPQVEANGELINVPVIFSNGEKWDNVRRLGYLRDEKGMLQSPIIVIKRNSLAERDQLRKLDINRAAAGNVLFYKKKYNKRNRYEDDINPIFNTQPKESDEIYTINVPEYVDLEYELLIWTDFTTQMNSIVEQIMPYGTFAWGNEFNKYKTYIRTLSFETVNTAGDDRIVRCTIPLTVNGTLLSEQEFKISTLQKRFSTKILSWDTIIDLDTSILFGSTTVPQQLLAQKQNIISGNAVLVSNDAGSAGGGGGTIDAATMLYITELSDISGSFSDADTIAVTGSAALNPITTTAATKNEFDVYINGQYIDKYLYEWTPSVSAIQTLDFNTGSLGYEIASSDTIVINGRWSTS
tara:strand:- start:1238 stop:2485 length:1248 start_codon:yes stop_codon:yes gene_type:complete